AAVVEVLKVYKIRPTPREELEEENDEALTPVDSASFFSQRSTVQEPGMAQNTAPPPPQPLHGRLRGYRTSGESSTYSPAASPRESVDQYQGRRPTSRGGLSTNGAGYLKSLPPPPPPPLAAEELGVSASRWEAPTGLGVS